MFKRMPNKGRSLYLDRKQVVGFGVRYAPKSGAVLIPMQNAQDTIVGLQVIYPAVQESTGRDKSYWPHGMAKEGAFHMIGGHPEPGRRPRMVSSSWPAARRREVGGGRVQSSVRALLRQRGQGLAGDAQLTRGQALEAPQPAVLPARRDESASQRRVFGGLRKSSHPQPLLGRFCSGRTMAPLRQGRALQDIGTAQ